MLAAPLLIAVALAAAPARIAVAPLSGDDVDGDTLDDLSRKLAAALEKEGFAVTSPQTTAAALGSDAFADARAPQLARALAVDLVAAGAVTKTGKEYQVDVRVISGTDAQAVVLHARRVRSLPGVAAELKRAARAVSSAVLRTPASPVIATDVEDSPRTALRRYAWVPALGAIVLGGAGTYFLLQTQDAAEELRHQRLEGAQAARFAEYGQQSESLAWTSFIIAAGAAGGAAAMYLLSPPEDEETTGLSVSLAASANGAFAGLRWSLP